MGEKTTGAVLTPRAERTRERMITVALFLAILALALFNLVTLVRFGILNLLLLLFFGVLLAVLLRGLARWVGTKTGLSCAWALTAVIIALVGGTILFFWLVAPRVGDQVGDLTK